MNEKNREIMDRLIAHFLDDYELLMRIADHLAPADMGDLARALVPVEELIEAEEGEEDEVGDEIRSLFHVPTEEERQAEAQRRYEFSKQLNERLRKD